MKSKVAGASSSQSHMCHDNQNYEQADPATPSHSGHFWEYFNPLSEVDMHIGGNLDEYIIMPNHVHVLVKPTANHKLADITHSWKSFTANKINQRLQTTGQLWQHESYDHIVRNEDAMNVIRCYIRDNPKSARASSSDKVAGASQLPVS